MFWIIAVGIISAIVLFYLGVPFTSSYLGWQLSGVWSNQSDTLQIMMHEDNANVHGHVVSAQFKAGHDKIVIGKMVVNSVKLRAIWYWSTGKYIDPYTMEEFDLRVKLKDARTLKVCFLEKENIVRKEEWKLIDPL